ncbi:hypothetical protein TcG_11523 [Trypanosoma cruzi]|nr:hypothetical protein TcG_11523 [Trypanosoma cruzi]
MRGQPDLSWIVEKPNALCDANNAIPMGARRLHAMCAPEGIANNTGAHQNGRGDAARRSLMLATGAPSNPPTPTNPPMQRAADAPPDLSLARRNRREGRWGLFANDARPWYDEWLTSPPWAGYMRKANEVARGTCALPTWGPRMSLAGQFATFCRTHEQPTSGESRAAFLEAILDVAPTTRPRHTRMLRSMFQMCRTLPDMTVSGLQKIAARSETKQARPSTKETVYKCIRSRADWKEGVVLRLAWITASRLFEIAALTPNNFKLKLDGTLNLDRPWRRRRRGRIPTAHCDSSGYEGKMRSTL